MNKILIICGPTATGKTSLAVLLAQKYNGEIISADSRQVYRGMDIVTGKDILNSKFKIQSSKLQFKIKNYLVGYYMTKKVKVWMLDVVEPTYRFNVSEYVELANKVITDILSRGKLPIVVGGTGFYLRGLFGKIDTLGVPPNIKLRKKLEQLSVSELQNKLFQLDQLIQLDKSKLKSLNQSDRNNPRRLVRAIEIADFTKKHQNEIPCHSGENRNLYNGNKLIIGLSADLPTLYRRIDQRVDERVASGAENEIRTLLKAGYNWDNSALGTTIGYRQWRDYFDGKATREEVIEKWQFAEHAYARRQITWFKKEKKINWFDISKPNWQKTIQEKLALHAWGAIALHLPQ